MSKWAFQTAERQIEEAEVILARSDELRDLLTPMDAALPFERIGAIGANHDADMAAVAKAFSVGGREATASIGSASSPRPHDQAARSATFGGVARCPTSS